MYTRKEMNQKIVRLDLKGSASDRINQHMFNHDECCRV